MAGVPKEELIKKYRAVFEPSYVALRGRVRVGGLESDLHLLPPMEFHANTSELVRMLVKGHHDVRLDAEAWDRLITWIDLNAPCHGTWSEFAAIPGDQRRRRQELQRLYGGIDQDLEQIPAVDQAPVQSIRPETIALAARGAAGVCRLALLGRRSPSSAGRGGSGDTPLRAGERRDSGAGPNPRRPIRHGGQPRIGRRTTRLGRRSGSTFLDLALRSNQSSVRLLRSRP